MAGIANIIDHIKNESDSKIQAILLEANEKAKVISDSLNKKLDEEVLAIEKKCSQELKSISERSISSSELRKKQIELDARYSMIEDTINKAKAKLNNLSDSDYIDYLKKVFMKNIPTSDCEILFNKKDNSRIKKELLDEFVDIAKEKGVKMTISKDLANIENGFILRFGNIDGNCSFNSLIEKNIDQIVDKVNNILFS